MAESVGSPDAATPELTAIVVVGTRRQYAAVCLQSLLDQGLGDRLEILLVDLAPSGAPPVMYAEAPCVRRIALPAATLFAEARAAGVGLARAPVVAFLEEHTFALPGWAAAVLEAHRGPWAAVAAQIVNGNPEWGQSSLIGLLNYGHFFAPLARGESRRIPGHNATFKVAVLRALGDELLVLLGSDIVLHQRLLALGHRFFVEPAAAVAHRNERGLRSIGRGIFLWYRCYGPLRAREGRWTRARRLLYIVAAPAIPLYYLAHYVPFVCRERKHGWPLVVRNLPFVYAMQLCGALGQAVGLLRGAGSAPQRFTRYELTEPRGPV